MVCYNIVLTDNNSNGTSSVNPYYYDWAQIPEGKYKVLLLFQGGRADLSSLVNLPLAYGPGLIVCDLGSYSVTPTSLSNQSLANVIGCIYPDSYGVSSYFRARQSDNLSFYLNSRPRNNNFTVSFYSSYDNNLINALYVQGFVLILQFELLE